MGLAGRGGHSVRPEGGPDTHSRGGCVIRAGGELLPDKGFLPLRTPERGNPQRPQQVLGAWESAFLPRSHSPSGSRVRSGSAAWSFLGTCSGTKASPFPSRPPLGASCCHLSL